MVAPQTVNIGPAESCVKSASIIRPMNRNLQFFCFVHSLCDEIGVTSPELTLGLQCMKAFVLFRQQGTSFSHSDEMQKYAGN